MLGHGIAFVVEEYPGIHGRIDLGIIGEHKQAHVRLCSEFIAFN